MKQILNDAIKQGSLFLIKRQESDGSWQDFQLNVGRATAWTTGFVSTALRRSLIAKDSIRRACNWLIENFRETGWGFNETVPTDCDSTVWGILALKNFMNEIPKRLYEVLKIYRNTEGLYQTYADRKQEDGWSKGHVDVTAVALRAILKTGEVHSNAICQTVMKLAQLGKQNEWHAYWWCCDMYAIAFSLEALDNFLKWFRKINYQLKESSDLWEPATLVQNVCSLRTRYKEEICKKLVPTDTFENALKVKAWIYSGGDIEYISTIVEAIIKDQEPNGCWKGVAKLRLTDPDLLRPWEYEYAGPIFIDIENVFTTALVIDTLALVLDY